MAAREGFELGPTPVVISQIGIRILEGCSEDVVLSFINVGALGEIRTYFLSRRNARLPSDSAPEKQIVRSRPPSYFSIGHGGQKEK